MNNPQKNTFDSRRELIDKSCQALASEIKERHKAMISRVKSLRDETLNACEEAMNISRLVEAALSTLGGRRFKIWWDEQGMPVGWAPKYLTIARTMRSNILGDKNQLRMIGILPEAETDRDPQFKRESDPLDWLRWAVKIRANVTLDKLSSLDESEAHVVMSQLEPLVEIYNTVKAKTEATSQDV